MILYEKSLSYERLLFVINSVLSLFYNTVKSVPNPIKTQPIKVFGVNFSCRKINARINVKIILNLSMGTTFDTSPKEIAL